MNRVVQYFRDVWAELHKISWPTRQQTALYTGVVLLVSAAVTLLLWVSDTVFSWLFRLLLSL
ncbi:MAG: preprotein translocase subunit SecE [Bacillota bacterium]|nr:preprotein translocase subunit SecE [Bacillota bacterium]MDI3316709.1 preprotein translocase subunit SecE [Bacillota bacterium]